MSMKTTRSQHIPTAEEVGDAKQQITDIGRRIEELERQDNGLHSAISPFLRLPTETLCEIAQYCVANGKSPVFLSQICSAMRHAVIGFKKLRNKISLAGHYYHLGWDRYIRCNCEEYFQLLLQRAAPLSLHINFDNPTWLPSYLAILSPYSPFLKTLILRDYHKSLDLLETHWPPNLDFKILHRVDITVEQSPSLVTAVKILDLIHSSSCNSLRFSINAPASNVQNILLHPAFQKAWGLSIFTCDALGDAFMWTRTSLGTWPHLKRLNLFSMFDMLGDFDLPNLDSLRVCMHDEEDAIDMEDLPISIRSLKLEHGSLRQRNGASGTRWNLPNLVDIDTYLTAIRCSDIIAPRLESFLILGPVENDVLGVKDVLDLTTYPYKFWVEDKPLGSLAIKKLHLCVIEVSPKILAGLKSQQGLQTLRLEVCTVSKEVLQCLSGGDMSQEVNLFPNLESIEFYDCHVIEGSYSLERFVAECRLNHPSLRVSLINAGEFSWADR